MGLFDVISGRRYRFNMMLDRVRDDVVPRIPIVARELGNKYELEDDSVLVVRDLLYSYYLCGTTLLQNEAYKGIEKFRSPIQNLSVENYKRLLSSIHVADSVSRIKAIEGNGQLELFHVLQIQGSCKMYGRAETFFNDWANAWAWLEETEQSFMPRLARKMYDDFASLIGGQSINPVEAAYWLKLAMSSGQIAIETSRGSSWRNTVTTELSAY